MTSLPARTTVLEIFKREHKGAPNTSDPARTTSFYWRLRAANGEIIADGAEGYSRRTNAVRAAQRAQDLMATAVVEVIA